MADAMKLVPCEPTSEMRKAGADAYTDYVAFETIGAKMARVFKRMLAASPPAREEAPAEGAGGAWPVITDDWVNTYCELTGRDPDGGWVTFIGDGPVSTTFKDAARREIDAMLCAAPKSVFRNRTSEPEAGAVANDNPLTFGMGALVVNTGKFGGDNAVFIAKATAPGEVGAYTGNSAFDRHTLQPGELVMIFPTEERVQAVADALVGPHPVPATADKLRKSVARLAAIPVGVSAKDEAPVAYCVYFTGKEGPPITAGEVRSARQALAALNEQPR